MPRSLVSFLFTDGKKTLGRVEVGKTGRYLVYVHSHSETKSVGWFYSLEKATAYLKSFSAGLINPNL